MNFVLERVTNPEVECISLSEMRKHLRTFASNTDEDALIEGLIQGAREWVEEYTGRALIDQTWRLSLGSVNSFANVDSDPVRGVYSGPWSPSSDGGIQLHRSPILAIESFATVDGAGIETVVDPTTYELREKDSKWPRLYGINGATWTGPLRVTFRAGFADRTGSPQEGAEVVPVRFLQAMKLWAEAMYDRDVALMPLLMEVAERLTKPERAELCLA
ncbi:MAG TPA: phage head-tail connector protein [Burkholderiales bacterium]|jgi:hypothetical protein|nr:phage head-tail connector protein [Burkholderiales bacterium]